LGNEVSDVITNVNQLLIRFAATSDVKERDERGCDIYLEIVEFSANVKKQLDANIYK